MTGGLFVHQYEHWRMHSYHDSHGELVEEWTRLDDVPGRAYPGRAGDLRASGTTWGQIAWTFACGAGEDLQAGDQIRFDGRTLRVLAVPVTSRGDRIEAQCEEVQ